MIFIAQVINECGSVLKAEVLARNCGYGLFQSTIQDGGYDYDWYNKKSVVIDWIKTSH